MRDDLDIKIGTLLAYYRRERHNPVLINLTNQITAGETTKEGKIQKIAQWIRNNIRYQREPPKIDVIVSPTRLVNLKVGDCEDFSLLFSTLSGIAGVPTKWRVIASGNKWSHIYPLVSNGYARPIDLTAPIPLGQEVRYVNQRTYEVK